MSTSIPPPGQGNRPMASHCAFDRFGTMYRMKSFNLAERPWAFNCVYGFGRAVIEQATGLEFISMLYFGRADDLWDRLGNHEKIWPAMVAGADRLIVHSPTGRDPYGHRDAEALLIDYYRPLLNEQRPELPRRLFDWRRMGFVDRLALYGGLAAIRA